MHFSLNGKSSSCGCVKCNVVYSQVPASGTNTANPYVKVYLLPDPYKSTKKKTKIAKRTLHPTYNETVRYSITTSTCDSSSYDIGLDPTGISYSVSFDGENIDGSDAAMCQNFPFQ